MGEREKSYQARVCEWLRELSSNSKIDSQERTYRFLEEALELAQASGCSRTEAKELLNYVYNRPIGNPELEAGGVMVTLAGLCCSQDFDMFQAGENELNRNWDRIEAIKRKRYSKPTGSPLPQ